MTPMKLKLVACSALLCVIASAAPVLAQAVPRTPVRVVYPVVHPVAYPVVVRRSVVVAPRPVVVAPVVVARPVVTTPVFVARPAYVYPPVVRIVPPPPRVGVFFAIR